MATLHRSIALFLSLFTVPAWAQPTHDAQLGDESAELQKLIAPQPETPSIHVESDVSFSVANLSAPDWSPRLTSEVERFLTYYTQDSKGREQANRWMQKLDAIRATIQPVLEHYGMPVDLMAVVMVESGGDPKAKSPKGALGLWQLMPDVGVLYNLKQTFWLDERMDVLKSTHAAAKYLKDLKQRLGSWELALAAYNMGYGGLLRSARAFNSNDFYHLVDLPSALPVETTQYVPRIAALAWVYTNRPAFNFSTASSEATATMSAFVRGGATLESLAKHLDMPVSALSAANPHLRRKRLETNVDDVLLNIPIVASKNDTKKRLAAWQQSFRPPAVEPVHFGERLSDMARRLRVRESALRSLNDLAPQEDPPFGVALAIPKEKITVKSDVTEGAPVIPALSVANPPAGSVRVFYKVIAGDTFAKIASFFQVSVKDIGEWNAVDLHASAVSGTVLQLFVPETLDLGLAKVWRESEVTLAEPGNSLQLQASTEVKQNL